MDDVAVATCTNLDDHIKCVTEILELAMRYDLFFKPEKCIFHAPRMDYCYVTVGTFARRGLSSTAKTLRSLSGVRGSEY